MCSVSHKRLSQRITTESYPLNVFTVVNMQRRVESRKMATVRMNKTDLENELRNAYMNRGPQIILRSSAWQLELQRCYYVDSAGTQFISLD
jgi:hypothetical protein